MVDGGIDAYGLERGLFPRRDDVPPYPPPSEMIECREALRQQERRLKRRRCRDTKREVLGHGGHGRDGDRRVRHGPLRGAPDAIVQGPFVRVVPAVRVGEEQGVDASSLKQFREIDPVLQVSLGGRFVLGVLPLARRQVPDRTHVECVEEDSIFRDIWKPCPIRLSISVDVSHCCYCCCCCCCCFLGGGA